MWKNKLQVKFLLESFALQRQHLYSIDNHNMKQQEESFQNPQHLFHIHINKGDNLRNGEETNAEKKSNKSHIQNRRIKCLL